MKNIKIFLGIISIIVLFIGILLKISHIKGGSMIFLIANLGLLAFFIIYLLTGIKPLTSKLEKSVGVAGGIAMCLIIVAFIFKVQHWAGAGILIIVSQAGLLITSILLIIDSIKETDQTKQSIKTLFAFTLFILTAALFMITQMLAQNY